MPTATATRVAAKDRLWPFLDYEPHPGQIPIHNSPARHRVVSAGRRFGKSQIGGHELTAEAVVTQGLVDDLKRNSQRREFWIVGPEYTDSEKEFRVIWNDLKKLEAKFDKPGSYNNVESGDLIISLYGGRFIVHGKSAKYPSTLVGEGLSGVILAEAAKLRPTVWSKYIRPTLADFRGWSIWSSTPEGRNHFYETYLRGLDPAQPQWASWRMPSWINPIVFPGGRQDPEILEMFNDMTEDKFNQEVGADFSEYVGLVFKEFDEEIHVTDIPYDPKLPLFGANDYGWTNPFVWLAIQVDQFDNVYVLGEYRTQHRDTPDIGEDLSRWPLAKNARIFYPDPASPEDTHTLQKMLRVRANPKTGGSLKWRLEQIRQALKPVPLHVPEDQRRPKLLIDRKCTGLIAEMNSYRYPDNKSEIRDNPEEPLDKDNHGPEALGRFFRGYFGGPQGGMKKGRSRVRSANMHG